MSSHRPTARRPRLTLVGLEDRAVPATFTCAVDPQQNMAGAVAELNNFLFLSTFSFFPGADTVQLFPGGTYVLGQGTGAGGSLAVIQPFGSKVDGALEKTTNTLLTLDGRGATLTRAADDKDERLMTVFGLADGYGRLTVRDLTFASGKAAGVEGGGAVLVRGSPVTFEDVRFVGNQAEARGGAVAVSADAGENWANVFARCDFVGNGSGAGGGGLATFGGEDKLTFQVDDCQFSGNTAAGNGGGMAMADNPTFVQRSGFNGNTAGGSGGGLRVGVDGGRRVLVLNSTFHGNTAAGTGGGLDLFGKTTNSVVVAYATVTDNTAGAGGGGLNASLEANVRVNQSVFSGNQVGKTANDIGGDVTGDNPSQTTDIGQGNWVSVPTGFNTYGYGTTAKTFFAVAATGDPVLGPLQNNGGRTLTRAPLPEGDLARFSFGTFQPTKYPDVLTTAPTTDQRGPGFPRGFFSGIGAYSIQIGSEVLVVEAGDRQVTAADGLFHAPVTVTVRDEYGRPVTDRPVLVRFQELTSGPFTTYPLGSTVTVNPAAPATPGSGSAVLYAGASSADGVIRVTARTDTAPAVTLRLYSRPAVGTAQLAAPAVAAAEVGTPYQPLSVTVRDAAGNPVAGADVYFTVVLPRTGSGQDDPTAVATAGPPVVAPAVSASGTFSAAGATADPAVFGQLIKVQTDAGGVATATFTAGTKSGAVTILVTARGVDANGAPVVLASDTLTLTNTPAAAVELAKPPADDAGADTAGDNQSVRVGSVTPRPLVVVARDKFQNPVPGVAVALTNLDPGRAAALANPGVSAVTDSTGRAVFAATGDPATNNPAVANSKSEAAPYTVRAAAGGLATDFQLTNVPGLPAGIVVVSGDGQAAAVSDPRVAVGPTNAFPAPLVVRVVDAGGNAVPGALVTFSGGGVRFQTATVPADADGLASATAATTDRAGTLTVTASADTGGSAVFTLSATPGAPAAVTVISGGGQSVQAGSPYAPVVVRVVDQYQNPIPGLVPAVSASGLTVTAPPTDASGLSSLAVTAGPAAGTFPVTVQVGTQSASFSLSATGVPIDLDNVPPVAGLSELTAVGLDAGQASRVSVYNRDGSLRTQFSPYDPGFLGGSRVATARGPLGPRVVVVPGPGRFPDARVFSADDGSEVAAFQPFEQTFVGGLYVSTGDLNRDGYEDYVFSADVGGGPRVKVVSGRTGATLQDFFGIEDVNFRGGARTAVGDVNGDGVPDLVVAAGVGGGPRIAVYDGTTVTGFRATPRRLVGDFFAFEQTLRNGAYVAAGDVTGDGAADLVLGGGPGGGPRVRVLNGAELAANRQTVVSDFFAGPTTDRGGVKVSVKEVDETAGVAAGRGDIVTASGAGDGSRVTVYLGRDLRAGAPPASRGFDDLAGFRGGVFVG